MTFEGSTIRVYHDCALVLTATDTTYTTGTNFGIGIAASASARIDNVRGMKA